MLFCSTLFSIALSCFFPFCQNYTTEVRKETKMTEPYFITTGGINLTP